MAECRPTIFEKAMTDLATWDGQGEAPAYPLYRGAAVAVVAKFPKFKGQVVIFPQEGNRGEPVSLHDLPLYQSLQVGTVAHVVAQKMQQVFPEGRIIRHDEGYGVPDHAHAVLFPAKQTEGRRLYDPPIELADGYFERMQELLTLDEGQIRALDVGLAHLATLAAVGDLGG